MRILGMALLVALLAVPAMGQGPGPTIAPPPPPPGQTPQAGPPSTQPLKNGQKKVDNQQRKRIQAIHKRYKEQRDQINLAVQRERLELADMLRRNVPQAQTEAKLRSIVDKEGQRQMLILQEYYEISSVLGPEEKKEFTWKVINQMTRAKTGNNQPKASP